MFTAAQLLAMTDNELGIHASGGYGAAKRNAFYTSLRTALARSEGKQQAKNQIVEQLFGRRLPVPQPSGD